MHSYPKLYAKCAMEYQFINIWLRLIFYWNQTCNTNFIPTFVKLNYICIILMKENILPWLSPLLLFIFLSLSLFQQTLPNWCLSWCKVYKTVVLCYWHSHKWWHKITKTTALWKFFLVIYKALFFAYGIINCFLKYPTSTCFRRNVIKIELH